MVTMHLEMAHLQIVGLKPLLHPTVRCLHRLGRVQLEKLSELSTPTVRPLQLDPANIHEQEESAHLLARVEGLLTLLSGASLSQPAPPPDDQECRLAAQAGVDELAPQVHALIARREKLQGDKASLPRYTGTLSRLLPLMPPSARQSDNISVAILVNRPQMAVLDLLAQQVTQITAGQAEIVTEDVDTATRAMLLVLPHTHAGEVQKLLGREDISRLQLPHEYAGQPLDRALAGLRQRLAAIPAELAAIEASLLQLAETWQPRLNRWRACLRIRQAEFSALAGFGETEQTFVLFGWLPTRDLPRLEAALAAEVGPGLVVQALPLTPADLARVPVALDNPPPARPFESLVRLLAVPRYHGPDPTLLMAFGLPFFFGIILGDVGYGGLLLLLSQVLLRRFKQPGVGRDVLRVLAFGSVWGIVFGVLFGEAFGSLGEQLGLHPLWLDRSSPADVPALLLFTLVLGAVHVTLGLVLGVWEAWRARSRGHLLERGGMLVGLIGLFLMVASLMNWLPGGLTPGAAVILVGVVLLGASYGWVGALAGPIEFIGVIGNILSYLRLAAIGLASLYLARVANDLAGSLGNIVIGAVVAVLIHALNLVMGAFSPTIHSLRLHYVEFFRKFYEGGGRPYQPFRLEP
jgi:V/A-type H+-transporting ATPase subunit I